MGLFSLAWLSLRLFLSFRKWGTLGPRENLGAFTARTPDLSKKVQLFLKVMLPLIQVLQTTHKWSQAKLYIELAVVQVIFYIVFPPFLDRRMNFMVYMVQVVVLVAALVSAWAMVIDNEEDPRVALCFYGSVLAAFLLIWIYNRWYAKAAARPQNGYTPLHHGGTREDTEPLLASML